VHFWVVVVDWAAGVVLFKLAVSGDFAFPTCGTRDLFFIVDFDCLQVKLQAK
jgi:hypothetical protein